VVNGGLMSYGTSLGEAYREVGTQTAKTLGFEFPATFVARADEVIE
jgi:hypothetical protein